MKKYKFIQMNRVGGGYFIYNNKSMVTEGAIGYIKYYSQWKQWIFGSSNPDVVWSASCLHDVIDFIENEIPKATK